MPLFPRRTETVKDAIGRLVREQKTDLLEQELQKFDPSKLTGKEKETWHLYWGIAAFRRGDRRQAFHRFTEAYALCPDSHEIRFSLGQEFEARGDVDKMLNLFRSCEFPHISSRHVLTASRYAYLWNRPDAAAEFLQPIFKAYFELGIADDHFVYVRGLPFFGETWSYLLCYAILTNNLRSIRDVTDHAKAKLEDYDFNNLILFLDC
jgi:tetratricopeptide (TPR) repeat protein